VQKAE